MSGSTVMEAPPMQCGLKDEQLSVLHCKARYSAIQSAVALPMGNEPQRTSGEQSYFEKLHHEALAQIRSSTIFTVDTKRL